MDLAIPADTMTAAAEAPAEPEMSAAEPTETPAEPVDETAEEAEISTEEPENTAEGGENAPLADDPLESSVDAAPEVSFESICTEMALVDDTPEAVLLLLDKAAQAGLGGGDASRVAGELFKAGIMTLERLMEVTRLQIRQASEVGASQPRVTSAAARVVHSWSARSTQQKVSRARTAAEKAASEPPRPRESPRAIAIKEFKEAEERARLEAVRAAAAARKANHEDYKARVAAFAARRLEEARMRALALEERDADDREEARAYQAWRLMMQRAAVEEEREQKRKRRERWLEREQEVKHNEGGQRAARLARERHAAASAAAEANAAAAKKKEQAAALAARLAWADMKAQPPTLPEHGTHTSRTRTLLQRRRPPVDPFYQPRGGPLWKVAAWPTRDKQEARRMMPTHYTWLGEGYM